MHHQNLSLDHWQKFTFGEQLANIGSEVFRAINWHGKNKQNSQLAFERSLELFDLTAQTKLPFPRLKELRRAREAWCDFFAGNNDYHTTAKQWENYFLQFTYLANLGK